MENNEKEIEQLANVLADLEGSGFEWQAKKLISMGYRKTQPESSGLVENCYCPKDMPCDCGYNHDLEKHKKPKNDLEPLEKEKYHLPWKLGKSGHKDFEYVIIANDGGSVCFISNWSDAKTVGEFIVNLSKFGHKKTDIKVPSVEIIEKIIYATWHEQNLEGYQDMIKASQHSGDCTKECHTCLVCQRERFNKDAKTIHSLLSVAVGKDGE